MSEPGRLDGDGRARRWAGQRAKRRTESIAAALVAVAEHGPATSVEHIATSAGIARPQLYRYFADAEDLHDAVAGRIAELVVDTVAGPLTVPVGSPAELINSVVGALVRWLMDNPNLYRYVLARSSKGSPGGVVAGVKATIGQRLGALLSVYATLFGVDPRLAEPCAFALVGMVEAGATRWLAEPGELGCDELVAQLSQWCWGVLDQLLRTADVAIDPAEQLPTPSS